MIRITFQFDAVHEALRQAAALLADMTPVYRDIGEYLVESTRRRFADGRDADGLPWRPKSPVTLALYRARGDRADPRPLFGPTGRLSREVNYLATRDRVEIGSSLVYAAVQQLGARKGQFGRSRRKRPIPWGNIPARPFLGLSADDSRAVVDIVAEAIEQHLDR